jgi:hypothetical protein
VRSPRAATGTTLAAIALAAVVLSAQPAAAAEGPSPIVDLSVPRLAPDGPPIRVRVFVEPLAPDGPPIRVRFGSPPAPEPRD